jgi:drug/metabolite transporter (DMT)-like permease
VVLSQFISLVMLLVAVWLAVKEPFSIDALFLGSIAGVCGAVGLVALYSGLARGPMGVVAPLTAVVAAVVPVIYSFLQSGLPAVTDLLGMVAALGAIWMISGGDGQGRIKMGDLWLPLTAGLGFGLFFILIAGAGEQALIWPLIWARCTSVIGILLVGSLIGKIEKPGRGLLPLISLIGLLDTGGNLFFIMATRFGRLDIAAILASLYPTATVFLAWTILKEKLNRRQWIGIGMVGLAVVLISA